MQRELVGQVSTLRDLDRVDLADQVGDRRIGGGELLTESIAAMHPRNRRVVTHLLDQVTGVLGDRLIRVVVDLAPGDDRHPLVEQIGERADHAGLGLTALTEEDHVVTGEQRVLELRHHGVLVAEDTVEERFPDADLGDGVGTDLVLDRPGHPPRCPQFAQRARALCHGPNLPRDRPVVRADTSCWANAQRGSARDRRRAGPVR